MKRKQFEGVEKYLRSVSAPNFFFYTRPNSVIGERYFCGENRVKDENKESIRMVQQMQQWELIIYEMVVVVVAENETRKEV